MKTHATTSRRAALPRTKANAGTGPAPARPEIHHILHSARPQKKLTVGAPDDAFEQEADRVADQVMRMPEPAVGAASAPPRVQRMCAECEEEKERQGVVQRMCSDCEEEMQAKEEPGQTPGVPSGFEQRFVTLHSHDQPLPASERAFFEPRFGRDLANVRLHSGLAASELARSVHARAFTLGDSIVFGSGQYAPGTNAGRQLLAHELTHVVQQGGGSAPATVQRAVDTAAVRSESGCRSADAPARTAGAAGRALRTPERSAAADSAPPCIGRGPAGLWVARTVENGCTPERTGQADPDGIVERGFTEAMAQVEEAIATIEVARGTRPPFWWESTTDAAMIVNYLCCCPTTPDLEFMLERLRYMHARLVARFPYRCTTSRSACGPNRRGERLQIEMSRRAAGPGRPGSLFVRGALVCPDNLRDMNGSRLLIEVAAHMSGLQHLGDRCDRSYERRYLDLTWPRMRSAALELGSPDQCGPGRGLAVPQRESEPPQPGPPAPPPVPDRSVPSQTVFVNDPAQPTCWSFVMLPGYVPATNVRHDETQPPNFIRIGGQRFDLCPDRHVETHTTPPCRIPNQRCTGTP